MKSIKDVLIKDKKVILRCDFNVPCQNGVISDNSKIIKSLDTINYLLKNNNTVILMSHFGRVKSAEDKAKNSLRVVYQELLKYLDLDFIEDPLDLHKIEESSKKCFLVENTRFTDVPEKRESANDLELSKYWSSYADVFVIDAFASLHRAHSSTAGLSKFLPTYSGLLVEKELKGLSQLVINPGKPFMVIMGGAKVDDKIKIMESMFSKCDKLILTGGILNTFLKIKEYNVGKSLVSEDEDVIISVKEMLEKYQNKILYSEDFIINRNGKAIKVNLSEIQDHDIIYDNIINEDEINNLKVAKTIFYNGTCGKYEDELYSKGTRKLLEVLDSVDADVYIGGGDTAASVHNLGFADCFKYISSGGGATLEYVAFGKLKALEYIEENGIIK